MSYWLIASIAFVLGLGSIGITIKLSLRHVGWPFLVLSSAVMYLLLSSALVITGTLKLPRSYGWWILLVLCTGALTAGTFPLLATALERAEASKVIPITAGYPLVTAILAAIFLSEPLSLSRVAGIVLIVAGAILVSR